MSGFGNQMRFVVFIHTLKEVTAAPPNSSVHLKVKYQNTSLRTKSYKLEKGRVLFDETFAFGRKQGKESDQITIQLRQDSIMSKSSRIGAMSVPLGDVLIGGKIDREVDFYPQGSGYISLSIEADSSAPLPLNNITQLNAASAGHDSDDEEFIPIGNLMGGIRKSGGGVGGKKGKPKQNSGNDMDAPGGDGGFGSSARGGGSTTAGGKTVIDPRTGKKTYIPAATAVPDVPTASSSATRTNNNTAGSSIQPQPSTSFPNNTAAPAHASHPAGAGTTAPPAPTQRKPKMRDGGSQTDMPQLSKEEIAALYDFHVPENAVSISYNSPGSSPVGGTTPASYRRSPTGSGAPGAFSRIPATRDRTVSSHGSRSMLNQQNTLGAPQLQQQHHHLDVNKAEMVAAANRNPRLQAMKNAAIAWPSDEVESIILYAQQMEKQRDDAEQRLAKVYAARAQQNAVALKDIPAARKRSLANGAPRSATTAAAAVGSPLRGHHPNMAPPASTHPQSTTTSSRPAQLDDDEGVPQWVHNFITLKEQQQTPAGGSVPEQQQWHHSSAPPVVGGRSQLMSNLVNGGLTQGDKAHILANYSEL